VFCREHAVQLHRDRQKFEDAGVGLVLIGQGTPEDAAAFREQHGIDLPILADRRRETYRQAGTKVATVGELFGPAVVARGVKAVVQNRVFQGRTRGHPSQLGGVAIVTPDGVVAWNHLAQNASDNPPNEEVLEAAKEAANSVSGG
jgi:peroxiredoxin